MLPRSTNRPRGVDVDHQGESGWSFNWKISRLGSLENAINVRCCTPVHVGQTGPVGHQPPELGNRVKRLIVARRDFMAHSTICERRSSMSGYERMTTPSICSRAV